MIRKWHVAHADGTDWTQRELDEPVAFVGRLYRESTLDEVIERARADERMRRDIEREAKRHGRGVEER